MEANKLLFSVIFKKIKLYDLIKLNKNQIKLLEKQINFHKLNGLFLDSFKSNTDFIKDNFRKTLLKDRYLKFNNLLIIEHALKLSNSLKDNSIDHIFLKSLSYAHENYFTKYRYASDIDILIHPDNFKKLSKIAKLHGYRFIHKNYSLLDDKKSLQINTKNYYLNMINENNITLDIHFSIFNKTNLTIEHRMLKNSHVAPNGLPIAPKELNLLHTTYHGSKKNYFEGSVRSIIDIYNNIENKRALIDYFKIVRKNNLQKEANIFINLIHRYSKEFPNIREISKIDKKELDEFENIIINPPKYKKITDIHMELRNDPKKSFMLFMRMIFPKHHELANEFPSYKYKTFYFYFLFKRWNRQSYLFIPTLKAFISKSEIKKSKLIDKIFY